MPSPHYTRFRNPYNGLAESEVTSLVVDTRDVFDLTVSWRTTSGATSLVTYWISDADGFNSAIAEADWASWISFGLTGGFSNSTTFDPPLGYRWARFTRSNSGASFDIKVAKLIR